MLSACLVFSENFLRIPMAISFRRWQPDRRVDRLRVGQVSIDEHDFGWHVDSWITPIVRHCATSSVATRRALNADAGNRKTSAHLRSSASTLIIVAEQRGRAPDTAVHVFASQRLVPAFDAPDHTACRMWRSDVLIWSSRRSQASASRSHCRAHARFRSFPS